MFTSFEWGEHDLTESEIGLGLNPNSIQLGFDFLESGKSSESSWKV